MSLIQGMVTTNDPLADEHIVDMSRTVTNTAINRTKVSTILSKMKSSPARAKRVNWLEYQEHAAAVTLAAGVNGTATEFNLTAGQGGNCVPGTLLHVTQTGEVAQVTERNGDVVTVVRSVGNGPAAAISTGAFMILLGNNAPEGSRAVVAQAGRRTSNYNLTQIQKRTIEISRTEVQQDNYVGSPLDFERREALKDFKLKREQRYIWGQRAETVVGGKPVRYSGGVLDFISANNIFAVNGNLSDTYLETKMSQVIPYGDTSKKIIFAGPTFAGSLSRFYRNKWSPNQGGKDRVYGVAVNGYLNGDFGVQLPVITMDHWGEAGLGGDALVLDLSLVARRPLEDAKLLRNRQENDLDGIKEEILCEDTIELRDARAHAYFRGVTAAA